MANNPTMDETNLRSLLKASVLFEGLDETTNAALEQELEFLQLQSGDILFTEGDPGDSLFFVIHGRLRVFISGPAGGEPRAIREIGHGETVGEIALVTGEKRSATVCAIRDTGVVRLSKRAFEQLINQYPGAMLHLVQLLVSWIREGPMQSPHQEFSTLALVPLGPDLPVEAVCRDIVAALQELGTSLLITAGLVDQSLGSGSSQGRSETSGQNRIAAWLNAREGENRFVVLVADEGDTPWTRRCIRHADRILYVARAGGEVHAHPAGQHIDREGARLYRPITELVMLHAAEVEPADAAQWLDRLRAAKLYHVRAGQAGDYRRLARLLTGSATTLVLGGGGARGFAHIGVLRALREAGVEIDAVGGTSMGSLIGAQVAMNWSIEEMLERNRAAFLGPKSLHDFTLPIVSLVQGRRIERVLAEFFGDIQLEDLYYDFFCVSTNLTRADVVVHRRGMLRTAVRASISVPGILPPLFRAGEVLVDGGVLNNLPVDVMRDLHNAEVIAVEVSAEADLTTGLDCETSPGVSKLLWQGLNPGNSPHKVPRIFDILMRSATLGSTRAAEKERRQVSLLLSPPIEAFGMTEWPAFDRLVDIGYRSSQAPVEAWLRRKEHG